MWWFEYPSVVAVVVSAYATPRFETFIRRIEAQVFVSGGRITAAINGRRTCNKLSNHTHKCTRFLKRPFGFDPAHFQ